MHCSNNPILHALSTLHQNRFIAIGCKYGIDLLTDSKEAVWQVFDDTSSSSRMRVINHNWSATKQRLHPQSVAEISRHSVLSGDRIRQCETSSGSRHKDTDQCP